MVYVPHPSEREDWPGGYRRKQKANKENKKAAKNAEKQQAQPQQVVVQQPQAPLAMVAGGAIAGAAPMVVMQPPPVEPGAVVIVNQPSQQPPAVTVQQPIGDGKNADKPKEKENKDGKEKKDDKTPPKGGRYTIEKHFGVCSCIMATLTGCVCAPCIYLCCPCDARTVYIADGQRYNKAAFSLSCGGCGCCCC